MKYCNVMYRYLILFTVGIGLHKTEHKRISGKKTLGFLPLLG